MRQTAPDGTTPLHWAVDVGDLELVQALLRAGATNAANRYGTTPLELAAENGNARIIDALLQRRRRRQGRHALRARRC